MKTGMPSCSTRKVWAGWLYANFKHIVGRHNQETSPILLQLGR